MIYNQSQEQLNDKVRSFASVAVESRQIASRLRDLLPSRLLEIKRRHFGRLHSAARAERQALADEKFVAHVNELVDVTFHAIQARVQYETHLMLVQARQSLRKPTNRQT